MLIKYWFPDDRAPLEIDGPVPGIGQRISVRGGDDPHYMY